MRRNLHHRVLCQKTILTEDGSGGYAESFSDIAEVWAEISQNKARPETSARQQNIVKTVEFSVRYQDSLLACRRIVHGTQKFRVQSFSNPDERKRVLIFSVIEETA